jgi:hypothetical protein
MTSGQLLMSSVGLEARDLLRLELQVPAAVQAITLDHEARSCFFY